jgi:hypothetical protein
MGLELMSREKHPGGSKLLTSGVNFWFHLDLGYPHPLGSRHLTQEPSQRSLERYPAGSYMTGEVKKRTQHNARFMLSLPVGSTKIKPSPGTFRRSWSRRWVGSQIIDLDYVCPVPHFLPGFLLRRRSIDSLALASSGPRRPGTVTC